VPDDKAEWQPAAPPLELPLDALREIFARAVPRHALADAAPLAGGLSNTLYRLRADGLDDTFVLRLYTRDPAACRKEIDLHRLVRGAVPVPEIVYADPDAGVPHTVMRWVDGPTFREIKQCRDAAAIAESAYSIGETLARIGTFAFPRPGCIGPALQIGAPLIEGSDVVPRFVEQCLESLVTQCRLAPDSRRRVREYIRQWAPRLREFENDRALVHSDFGSPNLVVERVGGRWQVAAVLDWEFAFAGSPLCDLGHIMRYERRRSPRLEPHFSRGFRDSGGVLPDDWFDLGRAMDLTALVEFLTRPTLPASIVPEIVELVLATVEGRDVR
jgi:aminoglycoside phosphotransferase (APT) family kinase protein